MMAELQAHMTNNKQKAPTWRKLQQKSSIWFAKETKKNVKPQKKATQIQWQDARKNTVRTGKRLEESLHHDSRPIHG